MPVTLVSLLLWELKSESHRTRQQLTEHTVSCSTLSSIYSFHCTISNKAAKEQSQTHQARLSEYDVNQLISVQFHLQGSKVHGRNNRSNKALSQIGARQRDHFTFIFWGKRVVASKRIIRQTQSICLRARIRFKESAYSVWVAPYTQVCHVVTRYQLPRIGRHFNGCSSAKTLHIHSAGAKV